MEKPVVLRNKRGKQLVGILHIPEGKKKWPLVVICHGFGTTKTKKKYTRLARALEKNKIASFRFDFEGCGDSEGKLETITLKRCLSDLESVMKWVFRQRNINKNKVAFLGSSFGATVVVFFIAKTGLSVKTLVFWVPALNQKKLISFWHTKNDLRKWKKQRYFIRKDKKFGISYLKENENKNYTPLLSQIQIPILIIHGKKDETVPMKFSRKLARDYKNIKLIIYPKTDHKFEDYYIQKKLIQDTVKWLRNFLKK